MPVYIPSLVVNLRILFDESLHIVELPSPVSSDDTLRRPPSAPAKPQVRPLVTRTGDENASFVLNRVPKSGEVSRPGFRQAGQFRFRFDFRDLPIDPRTIRAAAVEVHLGTVTADAFGRGMVGTDRESRRKAILNPRNAANEPNPDTFYLAGTTDKWEVEHGVDGSAVEISGRDWRGILLDSKLGTNPGVSEHIMDALDLSAPIHEVVRQLLGFHPLGERFVVETDAAEWPNQVVPAPGGADLVPRHRRGARGRRRSARASTRGDSTQLSYWDLIVNLCQLCFAIPYFDRYKLRIRPSRSIFDQRGVGSESDPVPTPFAGGLARQRDAVTRAPITPEIRVRRMIYGRNIKTLRFERSFGGYRRPYTVRCVAVDRSSTVRGSGRVIEALWPPAPGPVGDTHGNRRHSTTVSPGGQRVHNEILNIPVPGVRDLDRLKEIARHFYEEIGRGESGGSCETMDMASFGGDNQDPDLLRLAPGDAVELVTDIRALSSRAPLVSALTDHERNSFEEQVRIIRDRLGSDAGTENLARVIVATSRGQVAELLRFFRVSNVKIGWDADKGVSLTFDFQNYATALFGDTTGERAPKPGSDPQTVAADTRSP